MRLCSCGYDHAVPCGCGEHSTYEEHLTEEHAIIERLIVLYKCAYYRPDLLPSHRYRRLFEVSDDHYDSFEQRYVFLCAALGRPNRVVHQPSSTYPEYLNGTGMMEVDEAYPEVRAALSSLRR